MTEKRFTMDTPNDWGFPITDNVTGKVYSCASNQLMMDLCEVANGIVDENEQLKNHIKNLQNNIKRLENQNIQTYNLIREAYQTERTNLGKSVLKQLIEAIQ